MAPAHNAVIAHLLSAGMCTSQGKSSVRHRSQAAHKVSAGSKPPSGWRLDNSCQLTAATPRFPCCTAPHHSTHPLHIVQARAAAWQRVTGRTDTRDWDLGVLPSGVGYVTSGAAINSTQDGGK